MSVCASELVRSVVAVRACSKNRFGRFRFDIPPHVIVHDAAHVYWKDSLTGMHLSSIFSCVMLLSAASRDTDTLASEASAVVVLRTPPYPQTP